MAARRGCGLCVGWSGRRCGGSSGTGTIGVVRSILRERGGQELVEFGAGDFEGLVHFVDEHEEFFGREVAVEVALFELFGRGAGGRVVIFAEDERFAADAGNGVEKPSEVGGIGVEFSREIGRGDAAKHLEDLRDGDLENDLI